MVDKGLDWVRDLRSSFRVVHHLTRHMGDRDCWTIPLDITNIPDRLNLGESGSRLIHDPAIASSWMLNYYGSGGTMSFIMTSDENLYLQYITAHRDMLQHLTTGKPNEYKALKIIRSKK